MAELAQTRTRLFLPTFRRPHNDIVKGAARKFWFKGGRSSTKSAFISTEIVLGMEADGARALAEREKGNPKWRKFLSHAVIFRKYGVDIHDSVYQQIIWSIEELLAHSPLWHFAKSGRKAVYLPTGQYILLRGLDDAQKQKSIKPPFGWFKYLWFEELSEYAGMDEIRSVEISVQRGGHQFFTFASYNPPPSPTNWVNEEAAKAIDGRKVYHSTFLDVAKFAPEWLGGDFFADARATLDTDEAAFRHIYLGEITGTGAEVFTRVKSRTITQEDLQSCGVRRFGLDFGFESDPCALVSCGYDAKRRILYIYREWVKRGQFEEQIYSEIKRQGLINKVITADCAESRAIARLQGMGARKVTKCTKGPNSIEDGIHWLKSLRAIIIDPNCCPNALREFTRYAYVIRNGEPTSIYMDKDNHTIDAVRYAMQNEIKYGDNIAKWKVV